MGIFKILLFVLVAIAWAGDTTHNVNYANGKRPLPVWADGQVFIRCNFSQLEPHTELGGGYDVTFIRCNVKNCDAGVNARFVGCYQVGNHVDYCFWKHGGWPLDIEDVWCPHVVPESSTVYVDSSTTPPETVAVDLYREDLRVP